MNKRIFFLVLAGLLISWKAQAGVIGAQASMERARVYPNPWRSDRHANFHVTFDGLPAQANVKIFTLSGHQVRTLSADADGKALWDRTNSSGKAVASGIYLFLVSDSRGGETLGKLAIIR